MFGIQNVGNTCFLNTFIQIFHQIHELEDIYTQYFPLFANESLDETQFIKEWLELNSFIKCAIKTKKQESPEPPVISPNKFIHALHEFSQKKDNDLFSNFHQNDFTEFMMLFIQAFHTSLSRPSSIFHFPTKSPHLSHTFNSVGAAESAVSSMPSSFQENVRLRCLQYLQREFDREYSEVVDLLFNVQVTFLYSLKNPSQNHSFNPELCFPIDLPLPSSSSASPIHIYDCLREYTREDYLTGENAWWNDVTGQKENAIKRTLFWKLSDILILSLKRTSPCGRNKCNEMVDFPLENLDMSPFMYNGGEENTHHLYDLFAICFHYGNFTGGHYNACILHKNGAEWIRVDDDQIIRRADIQACKKHAYCLFYRKKPIS